MMPALERSSKTAISSWRSWRWIQARMRALMRVRLRRGMRRSWPEGAGKPVAPSGVLSSESDSIQMEGESQMRQWRADHFGVSEDIDWESFGNTDLRRWQEAPSIRRRAGGLSGVLGEGEASARKSARGATGGEA